MRELLIKPNSLKIIINFSKFGELLIFLNSVKQSIKTIYYKKTILPLQDDRTNVDIWHAASIESPFLSCQCFM